MSSQTLPEANASPRPLETAPSATAPDEPKAAQLIGLIGGALVSLGFAIIFVNEFIGRRPVGSPAGAIAIALGIIAMIYHALRDGDIQVRRAYGGLGYGLLLLTLVLLLPSRLNFLRYGWASLLAALCFLLCCCRHETDPAWRKSLVRVLGGVGAIMAAMGLFGGIIVDGFLPTYGLVLAVLGLAYLCAFVSQSDPAGDTGYRAGLAIGSLATFVILYAVLQSAIPALFKMNTAPFFVPTGLLLMFIGSIYGAVALGIVSSNHLVVLTRRELSDYFYSPIAYIVMLAMAAVAALAYWFFLSFLTHGGIRYEPIVLRYFSDLPPFIVVLLVPAITMRLLAEEKRSGTYEVLMCAPVKETAVVFSKYIACLIFFMLMWSIWSFYLIGLRVETGKEFDYRPLLSFYLALAGSGSGFVAMGLFFSSVSKNQIVAAVLTFAGMLVIFLMVFLQQQVDTVGPVWRAVFKRLTYYELWDGALRGRLMVRDLVLQASFSFFWLFLTVKVLEARRWS